MTRHKLLLAQNAGAIGYAVVFLHPTFGVLVAALSGAVTGYLWNGERDQ